MFSLFSFSVPSRSSSVQSLSTSSNNPSTLHLRNGGDGGGIGGGGFVDPSAARDLERMAEEGRNNRSLVDENLERNIGVTPGMERHFSDQQSFQRISTG